MALNFYATNSKKLSSPVGICEIFIMVTKEDVFNALKTVIEPDLGKDLVSLNMIEDLRVDKSDIFLNIKLTTPACPMKERMKEECEKSLRNIVGKETKISIGFVTPDRSNTSDTNVLRNVKNIIAVFSGKGGVGKSTIASNLAISLNKLGAKVGLFDADIYGPSIPIMFGVQNSRPLMKVVDGKNKIVPIEKYGIYLMSMGLLVDEKQAVVWRGPMVSSAIKQFSTDVDWKDLDYLIIDMPPGTGDIHLTLIQTLKISGAVIVSTPQAVALADAKKAIAMFSQAQSNIPIIGIIENMSYFVSEEDQKNKHYLFGKLGAKKLASDLELPFLGQIPLIQKICDSGDIGNPIVNTADDDSLIKLSFDMVTKNIVRSLSMYLEKIDRSDITKTMEYLPIL